MIFRALPYFSCAGYEPQFTKKVDECKQTVTKFTVRILETTLSVYPNRLLKSALNEKLCEKEIFHFLQKKHSINVKYGAKVFDFEQ